MPRKVGRLSKRGDRQGQNGKKKKAHGGMKPQGEFGQDRAPEWHATTILRAVSKMQWEKN